ncbi:MAG: hypothetical protein M1831_000024 [Alyxoria varia]|nr:MAG: hypothetical protein M1831_000024 [Alyxoria varia]
MATDTLNDRFARALPNTSQYFKYYHISTPPTQCPALYAPLAGSLPEKTYCESHFLLVGVPSPGAHAPDDAKADDGTAPVAIFGVEVCIYTTAHLTTMFISKADTSGLSSLLDYNRAEYPLSLSKIFSSTFVSHLVAQHHRPDRKLVISLFARSQGQYLFPGSVEHGKKNVLDDRLLVKWWCKTLDPVLREYPHERVAAGSSTRQNTTSKAYLIVPGHDRHETLAFFPQHARYENPKRWVNDHPLRELATNSSLPPRCVVPHFPDDPKSRFLDDLDEELRDVPNSQNMQSESPSKRGTGMWKSVKTLDQFWDMMAFRSECGSGRLVGFLWIVFSPLRELETGSSGEKAPSDVNFVPDSPSLRPARRKSLNTSTATSTPKKPKLTQRPKKPHRRRRLKLTGAIVPRTPRIKVASFSISPSKNTSHQSTQRKAQPPEKSTHFFWPVASRGNLVLPEKSYTRVHEILLRLDFSSVDSARGSTRKWIAEAAVTAGLPQSKDWGVSVSGKYSSVSNTPQAAGEKRKAEDELTNGASNGSREAVMNARKTPPAAGINTLGAGLVRKKAKTSDDSSNITVHKADPAPGNGPIPVNVLGAGVIHKKSKAN